MGRYSGAGAAQGGNIAGKQVQPGLYESLQRSKNVEALLSKGLATASPEHMDTLFSDLWYNANAAQENLLQLPLSHQVVARTAKF